MLIHTGTPSNRRGVKIQLALLAAIVLFTGILLSDFSWPTQEPTYKRRSVTDWMMRMEPGSPTLNEGLSVIGTNAIPYLIKALATKESFHNRCLRLYLGRILPDALTQRSRMHRLFGTLPQPWVPSISADLSRPWVAWLAAQIVAPARRSASPSHTERSRDLLKLRSGMFIVPDAPYAPSSGGAACNSTPQTNGKETARLLTTDFANPISR